MAVPHPPEPTEQEFAVEPATTEPAVIGAQQLRLVSTLVVLIGIGLFLAMPLVLSSGAVVFLPLVTAVILSIALSPLADQLMRVGLPNGLASAAAVLFFIALVVLVSALILQPAMALVDDIPTMVGRASQQLARLRNSLDWMNDLARSFARITGHPATREVVVATPSLVEQLAFATPSVILETLLTLLMSFFMIESRLRLRQHLLFDRTSFGSSLKAARLVRAVQERVGTYILTVGCINLGVGIITAIGAWALGWNAPVMWGGIATLLNFLPYIGPLTMIGGLALVGLATYDTVAMGLVAPIAFLCLHAVESNIVTPSILGRRFTINPVLILFSFSYFTWIWGVLGALLSVPILVTLTAAVDHLGKPNLVGFIFGEPLFPMLPVLAAGEESAGGLAPQEPAAQPVEPASA